ncbi:tRNA (mnm(5)s(2)U34)-methyltransferase, chloroplastic-like [Rutidosis leptorrhynchoides]|uniref:tRNA (mnm(5)s(2)U34)-methyltransferase, chloroplastic-like n=1 Tax=Rutidosis leptorrhynchoides TaxID=125765 RepID=UPI003A9A3237
MMMLRGYPVLGTLKFNHKFKTRLCSKILSLHQPLFISSPSCNHKDLVFHSKSSKHNLESPLSGVESVMMDYIFGKKKATEVAHSIWKHVLQKGDAVVDATCGNGYDTLAMLNMVADESCSGRVYSIDIQETALHKTRSLLDGLHDPDKKKMVKLFATCHSKMEEVVPKGVTVRLVAFNLGYLPGGDKTVITKSVTTRFAMEAASRIVASGGLISILVYVGHPGGMEEYETVEAFASRLPVNDWICCKLQMLNRPLAPILVLLCKR